MSNIKYVIRHNDFAYNDEWYMTDAATLGSIKAIYSDKIEAEQAYKALVVHALYSFNDLCQFDICNGDISETLYEQLEAFILEKSGEEFDGESLPEMSEDDAFEFAKLSGVLHYQLIEIDDSKPHYVIFLAQQNQYFHASNYSNSPILSSPSNSPLFNFDYEDDYWREQTIENFFDELPRTLTGTLADLSDNPELFAQFIQAQYWLTYDEQAQQLSIKVIGQNENAFSQLQALNALLKKPFFEVRPITLEELATLD
jgi:hypothetical protein